jgi:hypothetical protein
MSDQSLPPEPPPPLQPPGGGGIFDDMEARVRVLETHIDYIRDGVVKTENNVEAMRSDVSEMKVDLATLKERITHLPGKGFIITAATGAVGAIIALLTLLSRLGLLSAGH